jgi:gliding motility-associated lipoprotein GldD
MQKSFKFWKLSIALLTMISTIFVVSACEETFTPKPRGYFRIDLPQKNYLAFDSIFPYSFEYPAYTTLTPDFKSPNEKYWLNLEFPKFKGTLHISYNPLKNDLVNYLEDSRSLVLKHIPKASAINDSIISIPEHHVYGMIYRIQGAGVASPTQFFLTDSSNHFLRGALYFNIRPNNDSMSPVIDFINQDINHFINSLNWK